MYRCGRIEIRCYTRRLWNCVDVGSSRSSHTIHRCSGASLTCRRHASSSVLCIHISKQSENACFSENFWGSKLGWEHGRCLLFECKGRVSHLYFWLERKKMSRSYKSNSNNSIYFSVFHFKNKSLTQLSKRGEFTCTHSFVLPQICIFHEYQPQIQRRRV